MARLVASGIFAPLALVFVVACSFLRKRKTLDFTAAVISVTVAVRVPFAELVAVVILGLLALVLAALVRAFEGVRVGRSIVLPTHFLLNLPGAPWRNSLVFTDGAFLIAFQFRCEVAAIVGIVFWVFAARV